MVSLPTRLALALGTTQTLAWASTYYIPAVVSAAAANDMGVSRTLLLGAFSAALLVAGLCSPRVGRFIDAHGGRAVLAVSALIMAAGQLLLAALPNVIGWYAGWLVLGLGMAMGLYDAAFATTGRLLGQHARPAIVGITLMAGFASSVGWPVGTYLVATIGWRVTLCVYAAIQLLIILPIILLFIPRPEGAIPADPPKPIEPGRVAAHTAFLLLAIYFTARAGITALVAVHALALLQGVGLTQAQAVFAAAMIGPAQVGARVLDWRFARGLSPLVSAWLGGLLLPLGIAALLAGAPALTFTLAYGMSNGILTINRGTLPLHVFGAAGYATLVGRLALPALIAQAAAPTLLAPLVDSLPAPAIFAGLALLALAAALCLVPLRR